MSQKEINQLIEKLTILANTKAMAGDEEGYYKTMTRVNELSQDLEELLK